MVVFYAGLEGDYCVLVGLDKRVVLVGFGGDDSAAFY